MQDEYKKQFLHQHTINEITSHLTKAVVYVDTETSLEETCKILGKNDILAVPILNTQANKFVGIVDIVDIACFVAHAYQQHGAKALGPEGQSHELFKDTRASDLLQISDEGKLMWTFSPDTNLADTFEPFSKGIHRALVTTEGDQKYHILSQVDAVRFIYESGQFKDWFSKSLFHTPALFQYRPHLLTISEDTPAIEGFKKLGRSRMGAVAVVNSEGKLIGNLSAADLRGVAVEFLIKTILRPAKNFLQLVRGQDSVEPITANLEDSLDVAVKKMLDNHIHRVWLVDSSGKLESLISLSDVCRVFTDYA